MSIGAIETALYTLLNVAAVTTTAGATGGIHRLKAPQGSGDDTIIVWSFEEGDDFKHLGGATRWLDTEFEVKAVCEGISTVPADTAYAAAHLLLEGAALSVSGFSTMYCRRFGLISYEEPVDGGKTYQHVGGRYRIMVDPT